MIDLHSCGKSMFIAIDLRKPSSLELRMKPDAVQMDSLLAIALSLYRFDSVAAVYAVTNGFFDLTNHFDDYDVSIETLRTIVEKVRQL